MTTENDLIEQINIYNETGEWLCTKMMSVINKMDILERLRTKGYKKKLAALAEELKVLVGKVEIEKQGWKCIDRAILELEDVDY